MQLLLSCVNRTPSQLFLDRMTLDDPKRQYPEGKCLVTLISQL